jgi:hypothetical protein
MKKPEQILIDLYEMGTIHKIEVLPKYSMTNSDRWVLLTGNGGEAVEYKWEDISPHIVLNVSGFSILRLKDYKSKEVCDWKKLMSAEEAEYIEYQRLKAKFDS